MRKIISVLLICATVFAFIASPASAKIYTTAQLQDAIVQTALAYYYKGSYVQYDSTTLTVQDKNSSGIARITSGAPPEYASSDATIYSVCSDFMYTIYKNAMDYELAGLPRESRTRVLSAIPVTESIVVAKSGGVDGTVDRADFPELAKNVLQPGDIVVVITSQSSGHAMLYAGDCLGDGRDYLIHCAGSKVNSTTGEDHVESKGAIRMDAADSYWFSPDAYYYLGKASHYCISILRPLLDPAMPETPTDAALARMQYRGIEIDRYASAAKYNSVTNGQDLVVSIEVKNNGTTDFTGLQIREPLPVGARIAEGSATVSGVTSADGVRWTVNVGAGKTVRVSYRITVTEARGGTVFLPGGTVASIASRDLGFPVGGRQVDGVSTVLARLRAGDVSDAATAALTEDLNFANGFYAVFLGLDLDLPMTLSELLENMFTRIELPNVPSKYGGMLNTMKEYSELSPEYQRIYNMILPEHVGGRGVYTGSDAKSYACWNRVLDYHEDFYQPGDIFVFHRDPGVTVLTDSDYVKVYIYLGSGKVAQWTSYGGLSIADMSATALRHLAMNFSLVLRPSLVYDDINTEKVSFAFSDVPEEAWYYSYVKTLTATGTVSGMTETAFRPEGDLTYGQALKLAALAVGYEPQPAGTHWASGYLTLAQNQGWLSEPVDLNAKINRLEFCRIAARAAGLTAQPLENPFTDTADRDVLALYRAGIIHGMTETAFCPEGLLTRAQVSKIIWSLENRM